MKTLKFNYIRKFWLNLKFYIKCIVSILILAFFSILFFFNILINLRLDSFLFLNLILLMQFIIKVLIIIIAKTMNTLYFLEYVCFQLLISYFIPLAFISEKYFVVAIPDLFICVSHAIIIIFIFISDFLIKIIYNFGLYIENYRNDYVIANIMFYNMHIFVYKNNDWFTKKAGFNK